MKSKSSKLRKSCAAPDPRPSGRGGRTRLFPLEQHRICRFNTAGESRNEARKMRVGGLALLAALLALPGTAHAGGYVTPTAFGDFAAFLRFAVADEVCHNIPINLDGTLSQMGDLAMSLVPDGTPGAAANLVAAAEVAVKMDAQADPRAFCLSARQLYDSYDPAHLKTVGVID